MSGQVVIRESFAAPASGGDFLRKLRKAIGKVRDLHPELANYELFDVGITTSAVGVDVAMYFKRRRAQ